MHNLLGVVHTQMASSLLVLIAIEVLVFIIVALSVVVFVFWKRTKRIKKLAGECQLNMDNSTEQKQLIEKKLDSLQQELEDTRNAPIDASRIKAATREYLKRNVEETLAAYKKAHGSGKTPIKNFQAQKSPVQKALSLRYLVITGEINVMKEEDSSKACIDAVGALITVFKR